MLAILALPSWQALHPAIVHFSIAPLAVAPLFIVMGLVRRSERGRPYLIGALLLMVLGTVSTFLATSSGEAAKEAFEDRPGMEAVLEQHEDLAETTQVAFSALTLIYAAILFGPRWLKKPLSPRLTLALPIAFLTLYSAGMVLLLNAARQGGRLVHELNAGAQASSSVVESTERD